MFSNKYKLYFHKVNDSKWDIESYIHVCDIEKKDDLLYLYKKVPNYKSGMFFLMKEDIKPMYEDKNNIKGGVWTFKMPKRECNNFWKDICYKFCNKELTNKMEDDNLITGISISPKINNCIFKLWICKSVDVKFIKNDIKLLELKSALYRNHLSNI